MKSLRGRTILIGKNPDQGNLLIVDAESGKSAAIGPDGSVPSSVSRCKPAEKVAHVKIMVDDKGEAIIYNLKTQNVTYVNGAEIASKHITASSTVELGKDRYKLNLPLIFETEEKLVAAEGYNISHLEQVWNDLQTQRKKIQSKQKKINLVRSGCGLFTMCAMPCIFLIGPIGYVLTGVGVAGNLYSFIGLKNDNTADVMDRLNEEFQDKYLCPNPKCNKFLGNISYRLLKRQYSMHCPYCKCTFIEK